MPYISSVEQIGIQQGHREVILSILKSRFGDLDENLTKIIETLTQMPPDEFTPLLLTLSREELMNRFIH